MSDCGLPDLSDVCGWVIPSTVAVSRTENALFAT
jgi:hypothetical protein